MPPTKPILLALTLLTTTAHPQSPTDPTTLKVYSRETIVDTTVTDKKGDPVHGLEKSNFTLKEDNKPQPIRGFQEFGVQPPTPLIALPKLPPNVYTNAGASAPTSGPVNIILLDVLNTPDPTQLTYIKRGVADYLKTMPQGTQVAVFELSPVSGLKMLQGFTADGSLAAASVDSFGVEWIRPPRTDSGIMTLEAINRLYTYAAGIKGRKNLMWFAANMPIYIMRDGGASLHPVLPPGLTFDMIADLYDRFSAAQFAINIIDAHGLDSGIGTVASGVKGGVGVDLPVNRKMDDYNVASMIRWHVIAEIAAQNGGLYLRDSSDFKSLLNQAIQYGNSYYTLSYVPPPFGNDSRYHTIEVKVNRPGLELTYRSGYNAVDPAESVSPAPGPKLMQAAMGGSIPPVTQLLFDVQVEPSTEPAKPTDPPIFGILDPKLKEKPLTRYSFEYVLPARQLTFAATPEGNQKTSVEFDIAAYNAEGKLVTSLSQSIQPTLTPNQHQQLLKGPFRFFQQLDLPPGPLFLRIGILDATSTKLGTLEIPLTVPKK